MQRSHPFIGPPVMWQIGVLTEHGICIQVLLLLFASRVTLVRLVGVIRFGSPGTRLCGGDLHAKF